MILLCSINLQLRQVFLDKGYKMKIINKQVVLLTNKPEMNYINLNELQFKEIKNHLKNKDLYISLITYQTKEDKINNNLDEHYFIEVGKLEKKGLKSRHRNDSKKNVYRYKINELNKYTLGVKNRSTLTETKKVS